MIVLQPDGGVLVTIHGTSRASLAALGSQEQHERVALRRAVDQAILDLESHRPLAKEYADAHAATLADLTGRLNLHSSRLRHLHIAQLWVGGFGLASVLLGLWIGRPGGGVLSGAAWQVVGFSLILAAVAGIPKLAKRAAWQAQQCIEDLKSKVFPDTSPTTISEDQRESIAAIVAEEPALQLYLERWCNDAGGITAVDLAVLERAVIAMRALKQYDLTHRQIQGLMSHLSGSSAQA